MKVRGLALIMLLLCLPSFGQQEQPPASATPADTAVPDLTTGADGRLSQEQMRQLFRVVADKDIENEKRQRDYTYVDREVENKLDGKGQTKSTEVKTYEILEIYGAPVQRLIEKDDKPLDAKGSAKEEEKIQKIIDKRKNESEESRRKRLEKEEKSREEDRKFVLEVADAFNFKLVGSEVLDGHDTWVLEGEPRPGYEPKQRGAKMLSKFKGRVWIDKSEAQWVKLDVTAIDTISVGFVLARVHKGTHAVVEMTKVNDEVWLPKHVQLHIDVRLALLKNFDVDVEQAFRDYKKFRSDTKITVVGEEKRQ